MSDTDFQVHGTADLDDLFDNLTIAQDKVGFLYNAIRSLGFTANIKQDAQGNAIGLQIANPSAFSSNYGSGRSSGGGSSNKYKPDYDWLYNLLKKINEEERKRNVLEKEYNRLLKDREGTSAQLVGNSLKELANLQQQYIYQLRLREGRGKQLDSILDQNYINSKGKKKSYRSYGLDEYAWFDQERGVVQIDWDKIQTITDADKGGALDEYVKKLEEWADEWNEVEEQLLDIKDAIDEINARGKTDYLEFEQRIYDALVTLQEKTINAYEDLSNELGEANNKILEGMREQIDLERQIRDNTKTEQNIADKEARLAYLRRDTSGANAVQIAQLEKEIREAREGYADNLIDQELERISDANEKAAEQRQQQIDIMRAQLEYDKENGAFWSEVHQLLQDGIGEDGAFKPSSKLAEVLESVEGWAGLSEFGKMNWMDELVEKFNLALEGNSNWMTDKAKRLGSAQDANGNTFTYDKSRDMWTDGNGNYYNMSYNAQDRQYEFTKIDPDKHPLGSPSANGGGGYTGGSGGGSGGSGSGSGSSNSGSTTKGYAVVDSSGKRLAAFQATDLEDAKVQLRKLITENAEKAIKAKSKFGVSGNRDDYFAWQDIVKFIDELQKGRLVPFATGGLNTFTGPAWLDGTKSKPELVLNAKDTQWFLQLRDILRDIGKRGDITDPRNQGNTYIDLDINAELSSDYDTDAMIARVKREIVNNSNYRNVNNLKLSH